MRTGNLAVSRWVAIYLCLLAIPVAARAQTPAPQSRIVERVNESALVTLRGNTHPLAQPQFDQGAAPPDLPMQRMLLVLKRSNAQESSLKKLLEDQQDPSSSSYHQWLTPDAFGAQFGPSDQDIQAVVSWLNLHGFQVARTSRGRAAIEFSGTAAQVRDAFQTEIHKYVVAGEEHWANSGDPQVPAALAPVVAGIATLHSFRKKPQVQLLEKRIDVSLSSAPRPQFTSQGGQHALGPWDYYAIYNITSVIEGPPGISGPPAGTGTVIAVVGRSNINLQDVERFNAVFNPGMNTPTIFVDGSDPGDLGGQEESEAVLDTTWSQAVAPGAQVWLVVSASTNSTDGVDLSELYIIDNVTATVMTESFGICEADVTASEATNISQLAEQAAAEGMTYVVSTGDTGAAGCDTQTETQASGPLSVNALASTPYAVAVGGTEFNENGDPGRYWKSNNTEFTLESALSHIPEDVWNQSCSVAQCGQQTANILAGGGGASTVFAKPSWQSGVAGIPNDGMRDIPDVSLTASSHDPYLLCLRGSCQPDAEGNFSFVGAYGTSAAAPSFAGMIALLNSQEVPLNSHPRLGQINRILYRLATNQKPSDCNGSSASGSEATTCVFNDITVGNNSVPGGTPSGEYASGPGYDLATGLGSVNVVNLINSWKDITFSPTTTTLSISPTTFTHGATVNIKINVTSSDGTPTGDVALIQTGVGANAGPVPGNSYTLDSNGSISATSNVMPGGFYAVGAQYAGDSKFSLSDSPNIGLTVNPEPSSTTIEALTPGTNGSFGNFTGGPYGSFVYLRADITGQSGFGYPSGNVNFVDGGTGVAGSPYALNSQGYVTTPRGLYTFTPGPHSIVANYSGDTNFATSSSSAIAFTITQAPTTTAVTANGGTQGAQLSATVSTSSGGNPPSGTVTFFIGGTQVGSPIPVSGVSAVTNSLSGVAQGAQAIATLADTQLTTGQYMLSATYSGDGNYGGSSSPQTSIGVQADYSLVAGASSVMIASPGGQGKVNLTVTGENGFSGKVYFSCSGLPASASCSFTPAFVSGSGSTNMMISTTAAAGLIKPGNPAANLDVNSGRSAVAVVLIGIWLLTGLFERRRRRFLFIGAAVALFLVVGGCGGPSSTAPPPPNPGTSPGTYPVTITATSGTLTHSVNVTVNIQ